LSKPGIISEYYFSDHYRVIVVEDGDSLIMINSLFIGEKRVFFFYLVKYG